jgi:hypothetical protein
MKAEACSLCMLAELRHLELQAENERFRSGRGSWRPAPTFSNLLMDGLRLLRARRESSWQSCWRPNLATGRGERSMRAA